MQGHQLDPWLGKMQNAVGATKPALHKRNHRSEKPMDHNKQGALLAAPRESPQAATKVHHSQK